MAKYIEGMDTRINKVLHERGKELKDLISIIISECLDATCIEDINSPEWRIAQSLAIHGVISDAYIMALEGTIKKSFDKRNAQNG